MVLIINLIVSAWSAINIVYAWKEKNINALLGWVLAMLGWLLLALHHLVGV